MKAFHSQFGHKNWPLDQNNTINWIKNIFQNNIYKSMFSEALNDLWIRAKKSIESQQKIILLSSTGILKYIFVAS